MKKILSGIIFVFSAFLWGLGEGKAEEMRKPVVFAYAWEMPDGFSMWLIGGFQDGRWYGHTSLPITVEGRPITAEEGMKLTEPVACSTALIEKGDKLTFYSSQNGQKSGTVAVKGLKYSCSAASTETFIDVETDRMEIPEHVMHIGVGSGWNAVPVSTKREAVGEGVVFVPEGADRNTGPSVAFVVGIDEYGDKVFKGTARMDGKKFPLTDAYAETEEQLEGFFIDLNGDGNLEFVFHSQGVGGFVAAFELKNEGIVEILALDLGD